MSRRASKRQAGGPMIAERRPARADALPVPMVIVVFLSILALHSTGFRGTFVYDDIPALVDNEHLRASSLRQAAAAPPDTTLAGRPVTSLSFAVSHALSPIPRDMLEPIGDDSKPAPWAFHAMNAAIHLAAALLLLGVVRRTLLSRRLRARFGAASGRLALLVAALWAMHPIQTASVTYVVQRAEALCGLFLLLTLYSFIRAVDAAASQRARRAWALGAVVACAVGMGSKEVMAAAPLVVLAWDFVFLESPRGRRWMLHAALAATWLVLAVLVAAAPRSQSAGLGAGDWTWWRYLATQAEVILHYLRLVFVPWPLVLSYDWPPVASLSQAALPLLAVGALGVATLVALMRRHPAGFAGAAFFLILAPTSSVVPIATEVAADHRMYLPSAAVIALVVVGTWSLATRLMREGTVRAITRPMMPLVFFVLAGLSSVRSTAFDSDLRLWAHDVRHRPANARAHASLGNALLVRGRLAEAEAAFRRALALAPSDELVLSSLGSLLASQGRHDEARPLLERAAAKSPANAHLRRHLGDGALWHGDLPAALDAYLEALRRAPDDVELLNKAAKLLVVPSLGARRDPGRALELAQRAASLTARGDVASLHSLGIALAENGRLAEAARVMAQAKELARAQGRTGLVPELERLEAQFAAGLTASD